MATDESSFQKVLQLFLEKEDHLIMIGTSLPDIAISARGLTSKHRKELKVHANFIYNQCLLPTLQILEDQTPDSDNVEDVYQKIESSTEDPRILQLARLAKEACIGMHHASDMPNDAKSAGDLFKISKTCSTLVRDMESAHAGKPIGVSSHLHTGIRPFMTPPAANQQHHYHGTNIIPSEPPPPTNKKKNSAPKNSS